MNPCQLHLNYIQHNYIITHVNIINKKQTTHTIFTLFFVNLYLSFFPFVWKKEQHHIIAPFPLFLCLSQHNHWERESEKPSWIHPMMKEDPQMNH